MEIKQKQPAESPVLLEKAFRADPGLADEVMNRLGLDDLDSFDTAVKPLKLNFEEEWKRRFASQHKVPLATLAHLETEHEVRYVFGKTSDLEIPYKEMVLEHELLVHKKPLFYESKISEHMEKVIDNIYPGLPAASFNVIHLNTKRMRWKAVLGYKSLLPSYGQALMAVECEITRCWKPVLMGSLRPFYEKRALHLDKITQYEQATPLFKLYLYFNLPPRDEIEKNLHHIRSSTNIFLSLAKQSIFEYKPVISSFGDSVA